MAAPLTKPADADPTPAELIAARPALRMHAHSGLLLDNVPLAPIAAALGTPTWVTGADTIRTRYRVLAQALAPTGAHIHYAVKANDSLAVLATLNAEGAGADVVSGGELARALRAGIPAHRIVFSGVGKTPAELAAALAAGIAQINVESGEELAMLAAIARAENRVAPVVFRLNPNVDAGTHDKISTGRQGDKFGIPTDQIPPLYRQAAADPHLSPLGLALHIGSQISSLAPYRAAYATAAALTQALRAENLPVTRIDAGGGLGIAYRTEPAASPTAYAAILAETLGKLNVTILVEPGRWLVAPAGVLLASVILVKTTPTHRFVVLDAAMNDLPRPALYGAWHGVVPLAPALLHAPLSLADIVGPICESSDVLARARPLPTLAHADLVAILDAGAYAAAMSSTYNSRPLSPHALIDAGTWHTTRPRQTLDELWHGERLPNRPAP